VVLTTFHVLGIQFVVQSATLLLVLSLVARREQDWGFPQVLMAAIGVSACTVAVELVCVEQVGWIALIPVLAVTLFVLFRFSWVYMSHALVLVTIFGVGYILIDMQLDSETWAKRRAAARKAAEEKRREKADNRDVTRYQQIADDMGFVPDLPPEPEPTTEVEPEPPTEVTPEEPKEPEFWSEARKLLKVEGTLALQGDKRVAMINREMREQGEIVTSRYEGRIYRWQIASITTKGVELRRLSVSPLE